MKAEQRVNVPLSRSELAHLYAALVHQEAFYEGMATQLEATESKALRHARTRLAEHYRETQRLRSYLDSLIQQVDDGYQTTSMPSRHITEHQSVA